MSRGWRNLRRWRCRLAPLVQKKSQLRTLGRARVPLDPLYTVESILERSRLNSRQNRDDLKLPLEWPMEILNDGKTQRPGGTPVA